MARIRSIKPEFPQSESMGRVSRDARLLFVQLWCICDDHGRARASSRMLASLLFPYDDDAPSLIDGWIAELQREGCVRVYENGGAHYLEVLNWLKHQKIDKPSKPQFPAFDESSRALASPRESSLSSFRKGGEGKGEEKEQKLPPSAGEKPPQLFPAEEPEAPDLIWSHGLSWMKSKGVPEGKARSVIGLAIKETDKITVAQLIQRAESEDVVEPASWLLAAAKHRKANPLPAPAILDHADPGYVQVRPDRPDLSLQMQSDRAVRYKADLQRRKEAKSNGTWVDRRIEIDSTPRDPLAGIDTPPAGLFDDLAAPPEALSHG